MESRRTLVERFPGAKAWRPTGIPRQGWRQVAKRVWEETQLDQVPLLAAGVAFWGFISLFPSMIAAVSVYGLVADPDTVTRQAEAVTDALPQDAASLIVDQMETISSQSEGSLNLSLLVSVLLALWTSSAAVSNIMSAINTAYDEEETRSFLRRKGVALLLTLGAVGFVVVSVGLIAVAPVVLDTLVPEGTTRALLQAGRWVGLVLAVMAGTAVLYKVAPDRDDPRLAWVSVGSVVATAVWLLASLGFSLYVDNFGRYSRTYGALAGVAILMLWMWITALIVLVGAEINAEAEQQTIRDTTVGEPRPMGERNAVKADSRPDAEHRERKRT
jgi:membrane protein